MQEYKLTENSRDKLIEAMQTYLDTRDKRYMFLRINFREELPMIQIEGTPHETACHIFFEFEKRMMVGSLMACMNNNFDLDLMLELKQK